MADDEEHADEQDEGLSTPQKVLAGAALGVAVPAAVGVARKMLGGSGEEDGGDDATSSEPTSRERRSTARPRAKAKLTASKSTPARAKSTPARAKSAPARAKSTPARAKSTPARAKSAPARAKPKRTREQLYHQATRLKIDGRSSMNKAQLERAVERAKSK